jgi:hypothetical protein
VGGLAISRPRTARALADHYAKCGGRIVQLAYSIVNGDGMARCHGRIRTGCADLNRRLRALGGGGQNRSYERTTTSYRISGRDTDKFRAFGLAPLPAARVAAPQIAECDANRECRVADTRMVNRYHLFVLEVIPAWTEPGSRYAWSRVRRTR